MVEIVKDKIRKSPSGKRVGYGIIIANGNEDIRKVLEKQFD